MMHYNVILNLYEFIFSQEPYIDLSPIEFQFTIWA